MTVGGAALYWPQNFFSVSRLFPDKRPISLLCAFTINDDGADTLSSPPTTIFKNSGSATAVKLATQPFQTVAEGVFIWAMGPNRSLNLN